MDVSPSADDGNADGMAVLPERGLVFSEIASLQWQLCKPKLLPIKSYALERLEKMEKKAFVEDREKRKVERAQRQQTSVGWTSPEPPAVPRREAAVPSLPPVKISEPPIEQPSQNEGSDTPARMSVALLQNVGAAASPNSSRLGTSQTTLSPVPPPTDGAGVDAPISPPARSSTGSTQAEELSSPSSVTDSDAS